MRGRHKPPWQPPTDGQLSAVERTLAPHLPLILASLVPCVSALAAVPPLMVLPGTPVEAARDFQQTLDNDLGAAAPIAIVDPRLYALVEDDPRPEILHQRWRAIGAQFLLSGTVVRAGGQIVVEARLVDLISGEFAFAKRYRASIGASPVVAHTLANDIVQVFTRSNSGFNAP